MNHPALNYDAAAKVAQAALHLKWAISLLQAQKRGTPSYAQGMATVQAAYRALQKAQDEFVVIDEGTLSLLVTPA